MRQSGGRTRYGAIHAGGDRSHRIKEDRIGTLEVGKQADMILVDGSPLEKPAAFCDRGNIKIILQRGEIYKNIL